MGVHSHDSSTMHRILSTCAETPSAIAMYVGSSVFNPSTTASEYSELRPGITLRLSIFGLGSPTFTGSNKRVCLKMERDTKGHCQTSDESIHMHLSHTSSRTLLVIGLFDNSLVATALVLG